MVPQYTAGTRGHLFVFFFFFFAFTSNQLLYVYTLDFAAPPPLRYVALFADAIEAALPDPTEEIVDEDVYDTLLSHRTHQQQAVQVG